MTYKEGILLLCNLSRLLKTKSFNLSTKLSQNRPLRDDHVTFFKSNNKCQYKRYNYCSTSNTGIVSNIGIIIMEQNVTYIFNYVLYTVIAIVIAIFSLIWRVRLFTQVGDDECYG